jgi:hypothetical protein
MDDFNAAIEKARQLRMALDNNTMMYLDSDYSTMNYSGIQSGKRLVSVGFYGGTGFIEHVQDYGVKP